MDEPLEVKVRQGRGRNHHDLYVGRYGHAGLGGYEVVGEVVKDGPRRWLLLIPDREMTVHKTRTIAVAVAQEYLVNESDRG